MRLYRVRIARKNWDIGATVAEICSSARSLGLKTESGSDERGWYVDVLR